MKWLLITTETRTPQTRNSNVGDEFARLGVQRLISEVDPAAQFETLDKEKPEEWDIERTFDKAVICGMPLFWSTNEQTEPDIWWWPRLWNGPVAAKKCNLLALGVGHVILNNKIHHEALYYTGMIEAQSKAWRIVLREPVANALPSMIPGICPSAFAMQGLDVSRKLRLCNMMPLGGHFGHNVFEGKEWEKRERTIRDVYLDHGFMFVAHTKSEATYAKKLGWCDRTIAFFNSAQEYLKHYATASMYIGNRLHGAAVCAAVGCPAMGITHDSRLGMVSRLGGTALLAKNCDAKHIKQFIRKGLPSHPPDPQFLIPTQKAAMLSLLREFMQAQ